MEHRWSARKPVQFSVSLLLPSLQKYQAQACDLSLGGLAISGLYRMLPVNAVVTLAFALGNGEVVSYQHMHAQVAHCQHLRTGFLFMDPAHDSLRELREFLYPSVSGLSAALPAGLTPLGRDLPGTGIFAARR